MLIECESSINRNLISIKDFYTNFQKETLPNDVTIKLYVQFCLSFCYLEAPWLSEGATMTRSSYETLSASAGFND